MEFNIKTDKTCYMFVHEMVELNPDIMFLEQCGCGCELWQAFCWFEDNGPSYLVDILMQNDVRFMYE